MKPKAIVFDLDGVLAELKPESERNNHTGKEKPIRVMGEIFLHFPISERIILTGRKSKYRSITREWINSYIGVGYQLIMQEGSTAEKNHIYKEKELIKLQERYDIIAMVDDNEDLIPVCKKLGILLLQVHI